MFERMEIADSIYEGVVEPSCKTLPRQKPILLVTACIIKENPPYHGLAPRNRHEDSLLGKSKNCLIYVPGNSSE